MKRPALQSVPSAEDSYMRLRLSLALAIAAFPAIVSADALTDLRANLGRLSATTPVRGSLDMNSTARNEDNKPEEGKATVGFEVGDGGLHLIYPRPVLVQADQEERAEAIDPERSTPLRNGLRKIRPLDVTNLLNAAAALSVLLESAQLMEAKASTYHGKAARVVVLKLIPKVSKANSKHMKKYESTLSIWLGDDGIPIAAEQSTLAQAKFMLMTFDAAAKENWTYGRAGDRLFVTRYEQTEKTDGFGQHSTGHTVEVVRIE
jgi:hypothetical protein